MIYLAEWQVILVQNKIRTSKTQNVNDSIQSNTINFVFALITLQISGWLFLYEGRVKEGARI
jgi:hypothetical protein